MRNHDVLCVLLDEKLRKNVTNKEKVREYTLYVNDRFGIPIDKASDIFSLRYAIRYENDFILFAYASALLSERRIGEFFSEVEIKKYSKSKFQVKKISDELKYDMVQINDDQWIGRITVKELMALRDAQVINYNENTQRSLQHIIAGNNEHYTISINKTAIRGIAGSFEKGTYIPNTITLNLPEECQYEYDEKEHELIIHVTDGFKFDIVDGYHRYLAMSREYNLNSSFDYVMELRIIKFIEQKAKQFIWQEDQKTKMKRVDSSALNQYALASKVIAKLQYETVLAGEINPNNGLINSSELFACINTLYDKKNLINGNEFQIIGQVVSRFRDVIDYLVTNDKKGMYTKKWDRERIMAVSFAAYKNVPYEELEEKIELCFNYLHEQKLLNRYRINKFSKYSMALFSRLEFYTKTKKEEKGIDNV